MMTVAQPPLLARPHNNRQLFSDHYLDAVLPTRPEWGALAAEAAPIMARIAALFAAFSPSDNEAQTEQELVRPVLAALGHTFEVQPALRTPDGTKKPDYVLYRDRAAVDAAKNVILDDTVAERGAIAVADAKYWDRPLDVALKGKGGDPFTNKNPSYQISFYMLYSGLTWGILTNGRRWRLYHAATAHKFDRFYEVDLKDLVEGGDIERFLYFYAPFRRAALDAAGPGPTLASILAASTEHTHAVGAGLKDQVYAAVRHLAQGFLDYVPNELTSDPVTHKAIYDNALIVLYRVLFILYAEARDLLPVAEIQYRKGYSLLDLRGRIARTLDAGEYLLPGTATVWPRLTALFGIINVGSPPLKVATFNGGLFDPSRHLFLTRYAVGDAHLMQALDLLARVGGEFVDYRDLAERHLGTIYEGLLEYHLATLDAPEGDWTVELINAKGERKASGSYYTPDFIVKYIVEQAVGPALREAIENKGTDAEKIAAVLAVNVLDPAMGSGHFPVEATEYIARFLVDQALLPEGGTGGEADLAYWKRRVAQNCIYGVDLNPLAVDLAKLSLWLATVAKDKPLSFLDHHLRVGNALVGARIADLHQSEGAGGNEGKSRRQGGGRERRALAAGQLSMLEDDAFRRNLGVAVDAMWAIEGTVGDTIAEVKEQERVYTTLRADLNRKYGRLANLASATRLGVRVDPALWGPLVDYATGRTMAGPAQFEDWLAEADALAAERHPFHWELEFPEVFFDRHGHPLDERAGFDAVVGNPPYVRQEELAPLKPYLIDEYRDVYHGAADLYVYFFSQGLRQLRAGGRLSYICSNSWLQTNFAEPLRRFIRSSSTVETLIDLGNNRTFTEAPDVCPSIFVIDKVLPPVDHRFACVVFGRGEAPDLGHATLTSKRIHIAQHDQPDTGWQLGDEATRDVFAKLARGGTLLGEVVNKRIFMGIKTGLNDAFVIDQTVCERLVRDDPACADRIKPLLRGEDLRPWYQENEGRWLILFSRGWTRDTFGVGLSEVEAWEKLRARYPGIAQHLAPFADAARTRGDKGGYWWELRSCDYYDALEAPKILWPDIGKIPRFSYAEPGVYIANTSYFTPTPDMFLLGFLQSRVAWMLVSRICLHNKFRGGLWEYRLFTQFISRLPIPDASPDEREAIGTLASAITDQSRARYDLHRKAQGRILSDLGADDKRLNQKLTAWWTLDFPAFRAELGKVFRRDISVKERDDWEVWLSDRRAEHERRTAEIVRLEAELNARIYALFGLTPDDIAIVEESTKYRYGEV